MRSSEFVSELKINNTQGIGRVPLNQEVDYFGLEVTMTPQMFLQLALPLNINDPEEIKIVKWVEQHLDHPGIGAPFLQIIIPPEWKDGVFDKPARVDEHDGRHRMYAILKQQGNQPVEVHLFPRGGLRRRDISPEWIQQLQKHMVSQRGFTVNGPIFQNAK